MPVPWSPVVGLPLIRSPAPRLPVLRLLVSPLASAADRRLRWPPAACTRLVIAHPGFPSRYGIWLTVVYTRGPERPAPYLLGAAVVIRC